MDNIPGIGQKDSELAAKHFQIGEKLKEASFEELESLLGKSKSGSRNSLSNKKGNPIKVPFSGAQQLLVFPEVVLTSPKFHFFPLRSPHSFLAGSSIIGIVDGIIIRILHLLNSAMEQATGKHLTAVLVLSRVIAVEPNNSILSHDCETIF